MKEKIGFHNSTEEEIKAREKYSKIREIIGAEELAMLFINESQTKLQKHMNVFDQIGKIEGEGFFSLLKTPTDMNIIKEITIKFWEWINPEWKKEVEDIFNGKNQNVKLNTYRDDKRFRADHSILKVKGEGIQIPEDMLKNIEKKNPELYNQIIEINKDKSITCINLSLTGNLNDIYNLVHEITHYFTVRDTATEQIYSEVAPQCMERLLDEFLLQLPSEDLSKYHFKKEELREDIRKRRIISFASRHKATKGFIEKNKNQEFKKEEEELLKYFLAQIFQEQFRKYDEKDKKKKIVEFIQYVKDDNFELATKTFGIDWSNKLRRSFYVESVIENIKKDLEAKPKNAVIHKNNTKGEQEQK